MKKKTALITGSSGTVGTVLCNALQNLQWQVHTWNRHEVPVDDYIKMEQFIHHIKPDVLFHLAYSNDPAISWKVNYEWPSQLAWICRLQEVKFIFTSTNLVFKNRSKPISRNAVPDAESGYGFEKRRAEEAVVSQNSDSVIARLGWQMGVDCGSNNMIHFFEDQMLRNGIINVSTKWYPGSSFLTDTAEKLIELADNFPPSIYMLDSNEAWNIHEIAMAVKAEYKFGWNINPSDAYEFDSRMIDDRIAMISLKNRLHHLVAAP